MNSDTKDTQKRDERRQQRIDPADLPFPDRRIKRPAPDAVKPEKTEESAK